MDRGPGGARGDGAVDDGAAAHGDIGDEDAADGRDDDACIGCSVPITWTHAAYVCPAACTWCGECAEAQMMVCTNCGDALRRRAARTRPLGA